MADGEQTYLYGVGRIAQYDAGGAEYFLADALGSVKQLADSAGGVQLSKTYEPFGKVLNGTSTGTTNYGFTGEWADAYIELIYLRTRWYSPQIGRFISRDIWQGNNNKPLSLNPWLYVYGNPINLTDPSGKAPECERYQRVDLTQWLVDEMNENRKGYVFTLIWTGLHFPELLDDLLPNELLKKCEALFDLTSYGLAYGLFVDVVKPHGLWDFKWRIQRIIGNNIQLTDNWYTNEVPGNIYFGFIGLAAGFNKDLLHCGADFATNGKLCSGSDPIEDNEAVEAGYDIYELSAWGPVTEHMLEIALARHPLIAAGIEKEPKQKAYEFPWPYPIGTFDDGTSGWIIKHR